MIEPMEDISRTRCHAGRAIIGQRWDTINHVKQRIDNLEDFDLLTISLGRGGTSYAVGTLTIPGPCAITDSSDTLDRKVKASLATFAG